ncbi:MAG TPA: hypothetical protein DDY91_09510 [Planctomycetaceae bacterium]|nr:hypothetical protein [Planctomycetaceae bacterium]
MIRTSTCSFSRRSSPRFLSQDSADSSSSSASTSSSSSSSASCGWFPASDAAGGTWGVAGVVTPSHSKAPTAIATADFRQCREGELMGLESTF